MGIVTARGQIDIAQFWPDGLSDADTANILVDISKGGMFYKPDGGRERNVTQRYKTAVAGQQKNAANLANATLIKDGKIKVRLQGIDAPELHYRPQSDTKIAAKLGVPGAKLGGTGIIKDYRQRQAETSVVKLREFLLTLGTTTVKCEFVSRVDDSEGPGDVVDKYGRFVGDILVGPRRVNLNHWILAQGLAVVSLYNSMTNAEVSAYVSHGKKGKSRGAARYFSKTVVPFNSTLLLRRGGPVQSERDGQFLHPKLYRRQTTWWAYKQVAGVTLSFAKALAAMGGNIYDVDDFLAVGRRFAQAMPLATMINANRIALSPESIVLHEDAGDIFDLRKIKITAW